MEQFLLNHKLNIALDAIQVNDFLSAILITNLALQYFGFSF